MSQSTEEWWQLGLTQFQHIRLFRPLPSVPLYMPAGLATGMHIVKHPLHAYWPVVLTLKHAVTEVLQQTLQQMLQ